MKFKLFFSILLAIFLPLSFSLLAARSNTSLLPAINPFQATTTPVPTAPPTPIPSSVSVSCTGGPFTYTGSAITPCTASYSTDGGATTGSLSVSYSGNTNAGQATASASWGGDATHSGNSGSATFDIGQAVASCTISQYTVDYDGSSHSASGSCSGVTGPVGFAGTTHTDAGVYTDTVTLTDSNYSLGGVSIVLTDTINPVNADCSSITGWSGTFNGAAHGASGSCTISGKSTGLGGLDLGASYTNVPGGPANWVLTNPNVIGSPVSGTVAITINPSGTSVSVTCSDAVYTGSSLTPCTANVKGDSGPLDQALPADELTYSNNVNPGTASVTAAYPGELVYGNYKSSSNTGTFTINKAPADCSSIQFPNVTYDGNSHSYSGACYIGGVAQNTLNVTNGSATNAGAYTLSYTLDNPFYSGSGHFDYKILPFTPTCNVTPYTTATVTYDGSSHEATGACNGISGPLAGLDMSATSHTNAGTYANDPWTFTTTDSNYTNTKGAVTDSIGQAVASCSISPYTGIYDGKAHGLSGACSGIPSEPTLDHLSLGATYTNVGNYTADWALTNPNYVSQGATLAVTITPATAICTVTPYNLIYNGSPHTATGSCTGVNGESPALNLGGTTHTEANTYPTDTWTMTDTNYVLPSGQSTTITDVINPANVSCNFGSDYSIAYDGATHGPTGPGCTTSGGPAITTGLTMDPPCGPNVSSCHITWSFSNPDYNVTNASSGYVNVTITKKPASVSAVATGKTYEAPDPTLATTTSGFVAADLANISFGATRAPGETVAGSPYLITPNQPTGAPVTNYTITLNNANFTISKANANCSVTPVNTDYTGNPLTATGSCLGPLGEVLTGLDLTNTTHTLPGVYATDYWFFTDTTGNFNNIANKTITDRINYLVATCTVTPYNLPYDGLSHTAGYACGGLSGSLTGTTHTNAGNYNDSWTFLSPATNSIYKATGGPIADVISKAPTSTSVTCPVGPSPTGAYYYTSHAILPPCTAVTTWLSGTIQTTSMTSQSTAAYSYTNNTNAGTANATYTYAATTNFATSSSTASFQITPAVTTTVITCPASVFYNGLPQTPCTARVTDTTSGLNLVVPVNYNGTNTAVGTATADASYPGDANHTVSTATQVTFQILKPTVTCTVNGYTVVYDENPHVLSTANSTPKNNCTTTDGRNLTSYLVYSGASNTNAGAYADTVTFHDPTVPQEFPDTIYNVTNTINKFTPVCDSNRLATLAYNGPYTATYHGGPVNPQFCAGAKGEDLSAGVTYNPSQGFINVPGGTLAWILPASGNYNQVTGSVQIRINAINATCTVTGYTNLPYDGKAHTATGSCVGINGEVPTTLNLGGTTHTDAGAWNDRWTFTSSTGNYRNQNGTVADSIVKADPTCTINGYAVSYDGKPHTATGACTGIGGAALTGLVLTGTTHTDAGSWNDSWSFTNLDYNSKNGTVADSITPADPICNIINYTVTYDGKPHTATGTCTGIGGAAIGGLTLLGTTHIPAGTYTDSWTFTSTNGDYNSKTATITDIINPADAKCTFADSTVPYDGKAHGALGSCTGIPGDDLSTSVNLGPSYINVPGGAANWSFSNANYNPQTGTVNITITQIASLITVNCPTAAQPYTGLPITPCTAAVTDAVGTVLVPAPLTYTNNTNVGTATATETYLGDVNHTPNSGQATFTITGVNSTVTVTCPAAPQPYTGQAQTPCSATFKADDGLTGPVNVTYTNNIEVGTATATAAYPGDTNHNPSSNSATFVISKATATCTVTPYTATYDGNPHTATFTCTGIGGASLTGLDVSLTAHTAAGSYPNDPWSFTNPDYNSLNGVVTDNIARAVPVCTVTPYTATYDGNAHTATGACVGVKGEALSGLNVDGTNHTNIGDYTTDTWTFTDLVTGNYASTTGTVHDSITKADAVCTVTPYTVPFDGDPHTATGTCTGVNGALLNGLDLSGTTHTNAGDYPADTWTFNNISGNYNTLTGTVHDNIGKPAVTCTVTPYTSAYDGSAHTATGYCTGVGGVTVAGIDLGGTTHTDAGDYPGDTWTFTDAAGNYASATGTVHDSLAKIKASCSVNPYSLTYDGSAHTATGSCSGLSGVSVSGLDLSGTSHTDAGDYAADPWTLKNTDYFASDTVHDIINKTTATCNIVGYTGVYDGLSHAASGDCVSAAGAKLPGLNVGQVYKEVPGGKAGWNFINTNVSNAPLTGNVDITLTQASSTVTVTCPDSVTYAGSPLTPCTATVTGPGGLNQSLTVSYTNNNDMGTATASASFAGDLDHTGSSNSATFNITLGTLAGAPLTGGEGSTVAKNLKGESGAGLDEKAVVAAVLTTATPVTTAMPTGTKAVVNSGLGADGKAQNANNSTKNNNGKSKSSNFWSTYSGLFGCIGSVFLAMLIFFMFKRRRDDETEENGTDGAGTDGTGSASS